MPNKILLKAKFRGDQIAGSFKKGLNYNLAFIQNHSTVYPGEIKLETTAGQSLTIFHKNIEEFFDNWTDIKPR